MRGKLAKKLRKLAGYKSFDKDSHWNMIRIFEKEARERKESSAYHLDYDPNSGKMIKVMHPGAFFYPEHAVRRRYQLLKRAA